MRILVVEDDRLLNNTLCYNLDTAGYVVDSALTKSAASDFLTRQDYDLIVLDVNLPDGNGFDFCREVKERRPDTAVIFLTANDMESDMLKGYELGGKAVDILVGEQATAIREAIVMLGTMVVGSVAATWVSVKTSFHLVNSAGKEFLNLQKQLDGVYPGFLTAAFVIFCWWLMSKKKVSPVVTMLILVVVAFIGVMIGFFNPGLKY